MSHVPELFEHIFVPSAPDGSTLNTVITGPVAFEEMFDCHTVKTLNIGTPRPATVVVLNIKQFYFTMK